MKSLYKSYSLCCTCPPIINENSLGDNFDKCVICGGELPPPYVYK